jgi:hypothetical protein
VRGDGQPAGCHEGAPRAAQRARAAAQRAGWTCWIVGGAQSADEEAYERELRQAARVFDLEARDPFHGQRADVPALLGPPTSTASRTRARRLRLSFVEALTRGCPS